MSRSHRWAASAVGLLLSGLLASSCPRPQPRLGRVTDQTLAADAQKLGPRMEEAKIPKSPLLLEAYLAHFRGQAKARDRALCDWLQASGLTPTAGMARLSAVKPPSRRRMRAFLAVLLQPRSCRKDAKGGKSAPLAPGIYAFNETKTSLSGDTLMVQERWMIRRKADRVWGWYLRRMDRQSGDGRAYKCNNAVRYNVLMAFTFEARPKATGYTLDETDAYVQPGPCAPKQLRLDRCTLRPRAGGITLKCPAERLLTRLAGVPITSAGGGVYTWKGPTTPRADGNRQQVAEKWHLLVLDERLHGFYRRDKKVTARPGKPHKCNGKSEYVRKRLYLVSGQLKGGTVKLNELVALHRPGPCADAGVRLDSYQGTLSSGQITMSWGQGSQKLRRDPSLRSLALPLRWMPKVKKPGK